MERHCNEGIAPAATGNWFVWFIWFVLFVWLNETNR